MVPTPTTTIYYLRLTAHCLLLTNYCALTQEGVPPQLVTEYASGGSLEEASYLVITPLTAVCSSLSMRRAAVWRRRSTYYSVTTAYYPLPTTYLIT